MELFHDHGFSIVGIGKFQALTRLHFLVKLHGVGGFHNWLPFVYNLPRTVYVHGMSRWTCPSI